MTVENIEDKEKITSGLTSLSTFLMKVPDERRMMNEGFLLRAFWMMMFGSSRERKGAQTLEAVSCALPSTGDIVGGAIERKERFRCVTGSARDVENV